MSSRRPFRYPVEDDNEPEEGIDEQEQEAIITSLYEEDAEANAFYRRIFLVLPVSGLIHLLVVHLILSDSSTAPWFLAAGVTSLLSALTLSYYPTANVWKTIHWDVARTSLRLAITPDTCALAVGSLSSCYVAVSASNTDRNSSLNIPITFSAIIVLAIFIVSVVAWYELRHVDLSQLEKAKYRYKGA